MMSDQKPNKDSARIKVPPPSEDGFYREPVLERERESTGRKALNVGLVSLWILFIVAISSAGFLIPWILEDEEPYNYDDDWTVEDEVRSEPNVILISIDTLRADVLGCYGGEANTPFIDSLAKEGVRFDKCFTPNPLTLPAHATMLSGTSPIYHQVRDNVYQRVPRDNLILLPEVFRRRGYATQATVSSAVLAEGCGLERDFDIYDDRIGAAAAETTLRERNAEESLRLAADYLELEDYQTFSFIHLFDPHFPYWPPNAEERGLTPAKDLRPEEIRPLYIAEVEYVDQQLKRFFERLHQSGELKDATVIITADHGEDLGDKGELTHGFTLFDGCTRVPLIVWQEGEREEHQSTVRGKVVKDAVSLSDVFSGLLDFAGVKMTPEAKMQQQGISLKRSLDERASSGRIVYLESHYGFLQNGWAKLRATHNGNELVVVHEDHPEVYRPSWPAKHNRIGIDGEAYLASRGLIKARLDGWYATGRSSTMHHGDHGAISKEEAENLGYPVNALGAPSFDKESLTDSIGRPSPHQRIEEIGKMQQAYVAFTSGRTASALGYLEDLLNPSVEGRSVGLQAAKFYARVSMKLANQALEEGRYGPARRDAGASLKALRKGIQAANEVKLPLAALELQEAALLCELRLAKGEGEIAAVQEKIKAFEADAFAESSGKLVKSARRLKTMAAYTLLLAQGKDDKDTLLLFSVDARHDVSKEVSNAMAKGEAIIAAFP